MLPPFVNERQARLAVPYLTGGVIPFLELFGFQGLGRAGDMSRPFPTLENITESLRCRYVLHHIWGSCPHNHSPGGALEQFTNRPRLPEVGGRKAGIVAKRAGFTGSRPTGGSRCLRARDSWGRGCTPNRGPPQFAKSSQKRGANCADCPCLFHSHRRSRQVRDRWAPIRQVLRSRASFLSP